MRECGRSRNILQNMCLSANIGSGTAENERSTFFDMGPTSSNNIRLLCLVSLFTAEHAARQQMLGMDAGMIPGTGCV